MLLIILDNSQNPTMPETAITAISLVPRKALIFCSLPFAPRCNNCARSGYSVSSNPHSGGAILRPQSGTANIDINCSFASSSLRNSISPSDKIISFRTQVYHQPFATLKTPTKDERSDKAVDKETAAASSPGR